MITQEELNALVQLLQRTPMTQAEFLWVQALTERLRAELTRQEKERERAEAEARPQ